MISYFIVILVIFHVPSVLSHECSYDEYSCDVVSSSRQQADDTVCARYVNLAQGI